MATEPAPQRAYRAACPNCGAPVEFRSAASAFAACSYCGSTLLRDGEALRRIGQSAELFDDHSPLQLGASGRYQGVPFVLVGRVQWRQPEASWNEWHALFDPDASGTPRSGWLSEDNGQYVFGFPAPLADDASGLPELDRLRPGERCVVGGRSWSVGSVVDATAGAVQGELPHPPDAGPVRIIDLRNSAGEVGTLERSSAAQSGRSPALRWSVGRPVALADLALKGLREDDRARTLGARGLECPNCGSALAPTLQTTQSIVCGQCKAVVDISQGAGADLAHYAQDNPHVAGGEPQIPLGSIGRLALGSAEPLAWQVVGYVERCEQPDDPDDERTYWREYLLYHRRDGFAFLVDAEDGWSWSRPVSGAPEGDGLVVRWQGQAYRQLYRYTGLVTYVLGEFYWKLARDERTRNTDYAGTGAASRKRLNREQTANEVVWSAGETLDATVVAQAFKLPESTARAMARDVTPLGTDTLRSLAGREGLLPGFGKGLIVFIVLVVLILMLARCDDDDCDELRATYGEASTEYQNCRRSTSGGSGYRTGGGSFGGFSSGGGHK